MVQLQTDERSVPPLPHTGPEMVHSKPIGNQKPRRKHLRQQRRVEANNQKKTPIQTGPIIQNLMKTSPSPHQPFS